METFSTPPRSTRFSVCARPTEDSRARLAARHSVGGSCVPPGTTNRSPERGHFNRGKPRDILEIVRQYARTLLTSAIIRDTIFGGKVYLFARAAATLPLFSFRSQRLTDSCLCSVPTLHDLCELRDLCVKFPTLRLS